MAGKIETHHDLRVYQKAFQAAMQVFIFEGCPAKDMLLSDQIRRSSRSGANLTEAWRARYEPFGDIVMPKRRREQRGDPSVDHPLRRPMILT